MSQVVSDCCAVCGHLKNDHRGIVCGEKECSCLCFLEMSQTSPPLEPIGGWQESVMMGVLDLIIEDREGDIKVQTKKGERCLVSVRFVPELGTSDLFGLIKKGTS